MKRSTKIISAVVLSVGLIGGTTAYATYKASDADARAAYVVTYISSELNLDDKQKQLLGELRDKVMAVRSTLHAQGKPLHQDVAKLVGADTFDQQQALDMINSKTELVKSEAPQIIAAFGNFLDGLNSEQKTEILEFIEHKKEARGHGWKHN